MNLRNVLRTYVLLRQLTSDESALLETLRGMNDTERELLVESLAPEKAVKKTAATQQRKLEHCAACDYTKRATVHKDTSLSDYHQFQSSKGKSQRAASLAEQIQRRTGITICGASLASSGADCNLPEGHALHSDKGYVDHHPFQPASPARSAAQQSSASNGEMSTTASSGDETESAQVAVGGSE